ncbi:MAG TPA: DUF4197 domain-containing protein [Sphingobacteriaceae bacterium]
MKLIRITAFITFLIVLTSCETLNQAGQILTQGSNPTPSEIAMGLKQALEFGTAYSSERLSARDGFFGNAAVRILFPEEAQKVERTLRSIGLNKLADDVILSINRAAESAAAEARPIFVSAIRQMSFSDASRILLSGQEDAATEYFRRVTSAQLSAKFRPVIESSLNKVGATRYWSDAISRYNQIPLVADINPDLSDYVTRKAIDGLFHEIAQEELRIRTNLAARNTALLQRVFGYADRNRGG